MNADDGWLRSHGKAFGEATAADEFFHGRNGVVGDSLTETWYWNFAVPEKAINCHVYCWVHPNLDVVTAGLFVYRGLKAQHLAAEFFDMQTYLSMDVVGAGGRNIHVPNGLRMDVIEPLQHIHMGFADPQRQTAIDVDMRALAERIMRDNNKHFEQIMHCQGELTLRGEVHQVDCYKVRDRSWGELRPEGNSPLPAYTWMTGVFHQGDLAFNLCLHDDPATDPGLARDFPLDSSQMIKDGWIWREGRKLRLRGATKRTKRHPLLLAPLSHDIEMVDQEGRIYRMKGEIISSLPWAGWSNHMCHIGQARWTLQDGSIGYGESQDGQWNDYVYRSSPADGLGVGQGWR